MQDPKWKIAPLFFLLGLVSCKATAQQSTGQARPQANVYAQGVKAPTANFTGTVWVNMLVTPQDSLDCGIGSVTFEPGARTNWHMHPGGQVLLVTEGEGLYQEKGGPVIMIKKGDVLKCPPGVAHWHGATPKMKLTHIAVGPDAEKGPAVWLQRVTEEEYNKIK